MQAKALRDIPEFGGKAYKAGAPIPANVIEKVSAQVLRSLVENRVIEVEGMEPTGGSAGGNAHIMARLDQQADTIKAQAKQIDTLVAGCKQLTDRVIVLEGGKAAPKKPAKAAKASA